MGLFKWASERLPDWALPGRPGDNLKEAATHVVANLPLPGDPGLLQNLPSDPTSWDTAGEVVGNVAGATVREAASATGRAVAVAAQGDIDDGGGSGGSWYLYAAVAAVAALALSPRLRRQVQGLR